MYEGKHIHFSEVDNKPLCSYSPKLCKQRRLNGYAFCIRHVLEDKTAPFKQCEYVAKYNSQRCTNPIPKSEDRRWVVVSSLQSGKWLGRLFKLLPAFRMREELAWVNCIPGCSFEDFCSKTSKLLFYFLWESSTQREGSNLIPRKFMGEFTAFVKFTINCGSNLLHNFGCSKSFALSLIVHALRKACLFSQQCQKHTSICFFRTSSLKCLSSGHREQWHIRKNPEL